MSWTLLLHGGAGAMARDNLSSATDAAARAALGEALHAGEHVLAGGGTALDAVIAAVAVLEDDPAFNAGRGSALTVDGTVTLDAAVMDGRTRDAGAVSMLRTTRNPVRLAQTVMTETPHVMLSGREADLFAAQAGLEQVDNDWFITDARRDQLAKFLADGGKFDAGLKYGTVGAVARDARGNLAAATSTGGLTAKRWGRIGDSALIGAGTYADDATIAMSATGSGEQFMRTCAGNSLAWRTRGGMTLPSAITETLDDVAALGGTGAIIALMADGTPVVRFLTAGLYRAVVSSDGCRGSAIFGDERLPGVDDGPAARDTSNE